MKRILICFLFFLTHLFSTGIRGQDDRDSLRNLLTDLKSLDYHKAWDAAGRLSEFHQYKTKVVPALIEALNYQWDDCSGDIRDAIARTLGELKATEAVFPLLDLLKSGKPIAHECAECGCCFIAITPKDVISNSVDDLFCDYSVLWAINQLADFSHSKAMADIVSRGEWKPELLITIGKVGLPRYAHFISRYKDDEGQDVRSAVAVALGLIDNDSITIPVLIQILTRGSEDFFVKRDASNSLITIGRKKNTREFLDRLVSLLTENDKMSVLLTARALAVLGEEKGLLKLYELVTDQDARIREKAVMYLGEVSDTSSKDILIKRLRDENLAVRTCAIYSLGRIGDLSMIPILTKAFEESNAYEKELEKRIDRADREKYGIGVFDLRETFKEALDTIKGIKNE
ncbi:MAG: HEAT repeat domain-containing protein [Ignavibacteriae bacterium]|nr:HEAT repeat domain-containing protein [Ignavibacteriota bacterium]